jgi:hypothetical protein
MQIRKWLTLAVPIVIVVVFFAGCATRIGPGRVGIKVDLAGTQRGVEDLPSEPAGCSTIFFRPPSSNIPHRFKPPNGPGT